MSTKPYEQYIFDNFLDDSTIKSLSAEAFRGHQYKSEIINVERKYHITYRNLVKIKVIEKHGDIFAKIDQLQDQYKTKKKKLAESQKKAGHKRVTRRERVASKESNELKELKKKRNEARKHRDAWTKEILDEYFYKYDNMVARFLAREKIKCLVNKYPELVRNTYPKLVIKYSNDQHGLINAILEDRNASYERLKVLREEKKKVEKENKTFFTKQNLIDEEEAHLKELKKLRISDNYLLRELNARALNSICEEYPEAKEWQDIIKIRRELYNLEHEEGKNKFPCSPGTFDHIVSSRMASRKKSLGGNGNALLLPFCGWWTTLPRLDPFDGTVICGSQLRLKKNEICTPAKLLDNISSKFRVEPSLEVKLHPKHLRSAKIKKVAISPGWQPQVYKVDMLLRDKNRKKGISSPERITFTMFFHREVPPDADIREIKIRVFKKNGSLHYRLQLIVTLPDQVKENDINHDRFNAIAIIPCWNTQGVYDLIVADTYPNVRKDENYIKVGDSTRNLDGTFTPLSTREGRTYRQKREKAESLQHIADNYFDTVKLRLYNNYKEDNKVKEIFDLVLKLLADEKKSYEKVKLDYAYEWKDHKKFRGFARALLEYYFDKDTINKQIWGKWRGDRFDSTGKRRFKTTFAARKAGEIPKDLFHDVAQSSDGWNDITAWVDINYDRILKLANKTISLKILRLVVYFYFWAKKDEHLIDKGAISKQEKAINWRNDNYQKRAYELAKDYNYCILLKHDLKNIAQKPKFEDDDREDDDREEALVASNALRQKVAPSEFVNTLKIAFGKSRVIEIKADDKRYIQTKKDRDKKGLCISNEQLLFDIGTKIIFQSKK